MRLFMVWTAGLALALVAGHPAQAQITTGSIQGQVVDQHGGALPGASVAARNAAIVMLRRMRQDGAIE